MIKVRQVKINVDNDSLENLKKQVAKKLGIYETEIFKLNIIKKSLDARKKPELYFIYEVEIEVRYEERTLNKNKSIDVSLSEEIKYNDLFKNKSDKKNVVIVGAGPAGLASAYLLAKNGYKPTIIERGKKVEERIIDVNNFFENGILNIESNVQFGEGGAGTFSDGKLNTMVKDKLGRGKYIFELLVECGAPKEILFESKPHIGTDLLTKVIINLRNKIISLGGTFLYNTCLTNINTIDNVIKSIQINNNQIIKCDTLVLAIGHSSRDTFKMLHENNLYIESKPFAVGLRVMHNQSIIDKSQIGVINHKTLANQSYKLTYQSSNKRGVYSFCMCPGGYVVNASSEKNMLVVNGMSNHDRNSGVANSAIIVTISKEDFGPNPLDGLKFQRELETKAYELSNGKIPIQRLENYRDNTNNNQESNIPKMIKGDYEYANLNCIFPEYINESIKEGMKYFDTKIKGFNDKDTLLAGVESRTSSPIKITRDEEYVSNIKGIYPAGEGAGYAGGITSSFIDGLKVSEAIINEL